MEGSNSNMESKEQLGLAVMGTVLVHMVGKVGQVYYLEEMVPHLVVSYNCQDM